MVSQCPSASCRAAIKRAYTAVTKLGRTPTAFAAIMPHPSLMAGSMMCVYSTARSRLE